MVQYCPSPLDQTFAALSDPIRRAMLTRLACGDATVSELAQPHAVTLPAMLKHVRALERAGLVHARKEGRTRVCRLVARPLRGALEWLQHYQRFWDSRLDALERFLATNDPPSTVDPWTPSRRASASNSSGPSTPRQRGSSRRGRKPKR